MKICAYCGQDNAKTRDHIPPKSLFDRPLPTDLITVPACEECNNGDSVSDDFFQFHRKLQVPDSTEDSSIGQSISKTLDKNKRLEMELQKSAKTMVILHEHGENEEIMLVPDNSDAHDKVVDRITRGLYYHFTKQVLSKNSFVKVRWHREKPKIPIDWNCLQKINIGNGQFVCYYCIDPNGSEISLWIFHFLGCHWSSASTLPVVAVSS